MADAEKSLLDANVVSSPDCAYAAISRKESQTGYTCDQVVENFGFGRFQLRLTTSIGVTVVADAAQILLLAILGSVLQCDWHITPVQVAWLTTSVFLGMVLFSPIIGWIIDSFGRKKGILLTVAVGAIGSIISSFSPNYVTLLVLRAIVGASLAGSLQIFGFLEEFLPSTHRRSAILIQLYWPIGGLWASVLGWLMLYKYPLPWKWYLLMMSVPMIVTTIMLVFLPESVRFLGSMGKVDEAEKVLEKIARENKTFLPPGELKVEKTDEKRGDFVKLFTKSNRWSTVFLSYLWFAFGFLYYGIVLLTTNHLKGKSVGNCLRPSSNKSAASTNSSNCSPLTDADYTSLIWTAFAEMPGVIATYFMLETIGRKKTIAVEGIILAASVVPFFYCVPKAVSLTCLIIARATGQGAISALLIYTPEVYPTYLRGTGMGLCSFFFRAGGMITPFFAEVFFRRYIVTTIGIYLGISVLAAVFAILLPVETKGRHLRDDDDSD